MREDRPDRYYIPDNLDDKRHFFHIPDRNLTETAIAEFVVFHIVKLIPTDAAVKIIVGVLIMLATGIIGILGIKNGSVTEFIATAVKFQKKKCMLHYRRCDQRAYEKGDGTGDREAKNAKAGEIIRKIEDAALKKIEKRIH